jgi:hypothetical protein
MKSRGSLLLVLATASSPRHRSSHWLVRTTSRLLLVRAYLTGPDLKVAFEVDTPKGAVPFKGDDLCMARDWAPLDDCEPKQRAEIVRRTIKVNGEPCEAFVAIHQSSAHEWRHYGWAYVPLNGQLQVCGTMWQWRFDVEKTLDKLAECIVEGAKNEFGVTLTAEVVRQ